MKTRDILLLATCLTFGVLFIFPQILLNTFSVLDYAETVGLGYYLQDLSRLSNLIFMDISRFRPFYLVHRYIIFGLFKYDSHLYFITHGLILGLSLYFGTKLITNRVGRKLSIITMLSLLLLSPITIDAYWRLGVAENFLTLFLLISVFTLLSKRVTIFLISTVLLLLSKETAIIYLPVFLFFLVKHKKFVTTGIIGLYSVIYTLLLIPRLNSTSAGYTSLFTTNPVVIFKVLSRYIQMYPQPFLILLIANISIYLLFKNKRLIINKRKKEGIILLNLVSLVGILPVIMFENIQLYYLLPVYFTSVALLLSVISELRISRKLVIVFIMILIATTFPTFNDYVVNWQSDYAGDKALLRELDNKGSSSFYIDENEREDHISGLRFVLGERYKNFSEADYIITSNPEEKKLDTQLCGRTLFQKRVCKWYLIKNEL